jgi:hypothetical protein
MTYAIRLYSTANWTEGTDLMFAEPFSAIGVGSVESHHTAPRESLAKEVASAVGREEIMQLLEVQRFQGKVVLKKPIRKYGKVDERVSYSVDNFIMARMD